MSAFQGWDLAHCPAIVFVRVNVNTPVPQTCTGFSSMTKPSDVGIHITELYDMEFSVFEKIFLLKRERKTLFPAGSQT